MTSQPGRAAIFSGRSTEEVYALWREITAGDVAVTMLATLAIPLNLSCAVRLVRRGTLF